MHLKQIEAPGLEPISLAEAKQHLRISHGADDVSLLASLKASREAIENFIEISLLTQKWELRQKIHGSYRVELPRGPVIEVEQIKVNKKVLAKQKYPLTQEGNHSYVNDLDYVSGDLYVRYRTGFGDQATHVPAPLRQALLIMVTYFYENRGESKAALPVQVKELLQPYRKYVI